MRKRRFIRGVLAACLLAGYVVTVPAASNPPPAVVKIPIEFRNDTMIVKARINGSEPMALLVDTGFGINTLHPAVSESLSLQRSGTLTIVGIGGNEQATTYSGVKYDFAGAIYAPRRVASLPSDAQRKRRTRDGILGAGFFRRFVVEVDPVTREMTLHDPDQYKYEGKGEIIPLRFDKDTPIIEADIAPAGKPAVHARFEIDTGCDGALCLGQPFVESQKLLEPDVTGANGMRKGVGGSVETRRGKVDQLQFGKLTVEQPTANFFLKGSPSDDAQAGHIGMGALKQFRIIFDYEHKRMILEPLKPR